MNNRPAACVGVLVPEGNLIHEREFGRLRPAGVSFCFAGFSYPASGSADFCGDLLAQMVAPIEILRAQGAQLILLGCTTASMSCAREAWCARLEKIAGVPVITAAGASSQAMTALKLNAVAVATPYGDANNLIVENFIRTLGVEVASIKGLGLDRSMDLWRERAPHLTTQEVLNFSLSIDVSGAQAMYLPCTGIGSLEALELFEGKTGKPAFSSVSAGYWASLRRLGCDGRTKGYGRLIETWDF